MATILFSYTIKAIFISGVLLLNYWIQLRRSRLHIYNRFYLLATLVLSLIIPLLHFSWPTALPVGSADLFLLRDIEGLKEGKEIINSSSSPGFDIHMPLAIIYCAVSSFIILKMIVSIVQVYRIKNTHQLVKMQGFDLIPTTIKGAPFSFMRSLYWNNNIPMESEEGRTIWAHETTHIMQYHSVDKLFAQITKALLWVNPFYWLIEKELVMQHEYIADRAAIPDGDTDAFARMMLTVAQPSFSSNIVHSFFQSPIKRRLMMMTQNKKIRFGTLRKLLVVPMVLGLTTLFAFSSDKSSDVPGASHKVMLALDAAHGGNDIGAKSHANNIQEKDLTQRICSKIAQLAPEYNIAITTTRKDDNTVSLSDRVEITKATAANMFLSIHINSTPDASKTAGYEIIVNAKQTDREANEKIFASSIASQLETMNIHAAVRKQSVMVLRENTVPSIVLECGDINDAKNVEMLTNDMQLEQLCRKILAGVVGYNEYILKH